MIYNSLVELIGKTPVLKVSGFEGQQADILLKLEYFNPGGSVKDRIALAMIDDAEKKGVLIVHGAGDTGNNIDNAPTSPSPVAADGHRFANFINVI